jgi:hypothetical protein
MLRHLKNRLYRFKRQKKETEQSMEEIRCLEAQQKYYDSITINTLPRMFTNEDLFSNDIEDIIRKHTGESVSVSIIDYIQEELLVYKLGNRTRETYRMRVTLACFTCYEQWSDEYYMPQALYNYLFALVNSDYSTQFKSITLGILLSAAFSILYKLEQKRQNHACTVSEYDSTEDAQLM